MKQNRIIFIVGPTGVGKSAVAIELASILNTEIISCDAMQVYKEATIANDKPSPEDLKRVVHHCVDCVSVTEEFDVVQYRKKAIAAMEDIWQRSKIPLVVGGSGMYMAILLDGIFESAGQDPLIRKQLEEDAKVQGSLKLHARLKKVDPEAAAKISPNDERRIVRALEIYQTTRKPIAQVQKDRKGLWGKHDIKVFVLNRERAELYERVNARVDEMFRRGLVDEIRALKNLKLSRTAQGLIGLPEVGDHLDGKAGLDETKEAMKMNTRHYVKRQLTWFRKDKRLNWITIKPHETVADIAQKIAKEIPHE
jgi:tRNA dimethylallyltransferase